MYLKNLKKTRIFQKLIRLSIPLIQFDKKVASFAFKAIIMACKTSPKKNLGPSKRWNPEIRFNHIVDFATSVKVNWFPINGSNRTETFLPLQCCIKRTKFVKYQGVTLGVHFDAAKLFTSLRRIV